MAFVRFKSKFEAAYTIEKTNNTTFKGLKFRVSPATEKKVKGSNGKPSSAQNTALLLNPGLLSEPHPVNAIISNNSSAVSSGLTLQAARRDSHNSMPQLPSPRTINGTNTTNVNQNRPNFTSCDKTSAIMQERSNTKWPQFESPDEKPLEIVTQMKNHIQVSILLIHVFGLIIFVMFRTLNDCLPSHLSIELSPFGLTLSILINAYQRVSQLRLFYQTIPG